MQPRLLASATPLKEVNRDDDDVIKRLTLRFSLITAIVRLGGQLEGSVADWLLESTICTV